MAASLPSTTSAFASNGARFSASSAPTAPARRRRCGFSPATCRRRKARPLSPDSTSSTSRSRPSGAPATCQRVVIINKGRVVAVDTPDNLTARLRGSETMYVQVDASGADATPALRRIAGVTRVAEADRRDGVVGYEVDSEHGRDIRRDL